MDLNVNGRGFSVFSCTHSLYGSYKTLEVLRNPKRLQRARVLRDWIKLSMLLLSHDEKTGKTPLTPKCSEIGLSCFSGFLPLGQEQPLRKYT